MIDKNFLKANSLIYNMAAWNAYLPMGLV